MMLSSIELCAGAGGQALGLEQVGFRHEALLENDHHCCNTLRLNEPGFKVIEDDIANFDGRPYRGIDLLSGGLPCPPFSIAGKKLGEADERNLFPDAIRLADEIRPRAVMIENVRGFLDGIFSDYRDYIKDKLQKLGYHCEWQLLNASDFGVPQLRPRVVFVGIQQEYCDHFQWPILRSGETKTVGGTLYDLISARGWKGAKAWKERANEIAPTIVGGSKKHGGADLGPTRAKRAWANLGVDGMGIADDAPPPDFVGTPRLTVRMVARLQGFPDHWQLSGGKTAAYRQVGNAFPPPVAEAVGLSLSAAVCARRSIRVVK